LDFIPYIFIDNFINKFGLKKTLIIGVFFHCLLYFILSKIMLSLAWIILYLFVRSFINSFYIFPFHLLFSAEKTSHMCIWVSLKRVSSVIVNVITPLIGGLILEFLGRSYFFYFAIIFCFISAIPIIFSDFSYFEIKSFKKKVPFVNNATKIQFFADSLLGVTNLVWPFVIYFFTENFLETGLILFLIGIFQVILSFVVGYLFDKKIKRKFVKSIIALVCFSIFLLAFLPSLFGIVGAVVAKIIYDLSFSMQSILKTIYWYKEANNSFDYSVIYKKQKYSIMAANLGGSIAVLFVFIPIFFNLKLEYTFLFTIPFVLVLGYIINSLTKD